MNRISSILLILFVCSFSLYGQNREEWKQQYRQELQHYKDSTSERFLQYMQRYWQAYDLFRGESYPAMPSPSQQPIVRTADVPVRKDTVEPWTDTVLVRKNDTADTVVANAIAHHSIEIFSFDFYGVNLTVKLPAEVSSLALTSVAEQKVASFWRRLDACGTASYAVLLGTFRHEFRLDDWAFYDLARCLSAQVYPSDPNRQAVLVVYLLNHLRYDCRIGRYGNRLLPLVATATTLYDTPYAAIDGRRYHAASLPIFGGRLYTYSAAFPQASKALDMHIYEAPRLGVYRDIKRCYEYHYMGQTIKVSPNQQMMDYYLARPQTDLEVYASAAVESGVARAIEQCLRPVIDGSSDEQAVSLLLRYVQEGFAYGSDVEHLGRERTLFADELFHYPFSDCEDRVVLFAHLVRSLVGAEVVLVQFPDHVVAAVSLGDAALGCHYRLAGKKFIIADPTTRGARLGYLAPRYQSQTPRIIRMS